MVTRSSPLHTPRVRAHKPRISRRRAPAKAKAVTGKKEALNSPGREMGDDKPKINGTDPTENGISTNGVSEDVEMEEDGADAGPKPNGMPKKSKDGEDEMTVVVPPPKGSKLSGNRGKDEDGDVEMVSSETEEKKIEVKPEDPAARTAMGMFFAFYPTIGVCH